MSLGNTKKTDEYLQTISVLDVRFSYKLPNNIMKNPMNTVNVNILLI